MLGSNVASFLLKRQCDVYGVSRTLSRQIASEKQLLGDLSDPIFLDQLSNWVEPDAIVHTAAFVNLNYCEENKETAYNLHVAASKHLAIAFPKATYIYISTDSIFDGHRGEYREIDKPCPINYYAKSKFQGELEVLEHSENPVILRTNIYGRKKSGGNSLAEWAIKELGNGHAISGFTNVLFNPLYIGQVSKIIYDFIYYDNMHLGIFHLGCNEKISKFTFLKQLAAKFNFDSELVAEAVMRNQTSLLRPLNTTLDTSSYQQLSNNKFTLSEGIDELYYSYRS